MKTPNRFELLVEEMKSECPELWEQAQEVVKEYFDKVRSGEVELDIKSQFADRKDALWTGISWYIPYVTETRYYEGGEIAYAFIPTWRSRREMSKYLKAHKGVIYASFTCTLPGAINSVDIEATVE